MRKTFQYQYLCITVLLCMLNMAHAQTAPPNTTSTIMACAKSIRADELYTGGKLALNINGENMTLHIFEMGKSFNTHIAFGGRLTNYVDPSLPGIGTTLYIDHATHVAGVAIANDVQGGVQARGIAYKAKAYLGVRVGKSPYLNIKDIPATPAVLVSNHSYGFGLDANAPNTPVWAVGAYTDESRSSDSTSYKSPYWLHVGASGNEGTVQNPSPFGTGYDQIKGGVGTGKNALTVGGISNVIYQATGDVSKATIAEFSSKGPTDDYRIKPEIMASAANIVAPVSSPSTTASYSTAVDGTSLAAPAVAAGCLLLQQYYKSLYGKYMRAATLKGLVMHTANRKAFNNGVEGAPNVSYGYGLMDTKAAAEAIRDRYVESTLEESVIRPNSNGSPATITYKIKSKSFPLRISLSWTDPEGKVLPGTNDSTPRLKNDLDLKVTAANGTVYRPWTLKSNSPTVAIQGENHADPYEQIYIASPGLQEYTITVSYTGSLTYNEQFYSLIITGLNLGICTVDTDIITNVNHPARIKANKIRFSGIAEATSPAGNTLSTTAPKIFFDAVKEVLLGDGALLKSSSNTEVIARTVPCNTVAKTSAEEIMIPEGKENIPSIPYAADKDRLWPNPADDKVTLSTKSELKELDVYDIQGRKVLHQEYGKGVSLYTFDVSHLPSGLYIVNAIQHDGKTETYKLMRK